MNPYTGAINYWKGVLGSIAGADYQFNIGRPPYTAGDNTPVIIHSNQRLHLEPCGPNWAVDKIPDAEFYEVCGDPSTFQLGDQLWGSAQTPRVTVFSKIDGQEFLAIKSDKRCRIEDIGVSYSDLYFDYMNSTSAGPDEYYQEQTSLNNPVRRAILYGGIPTITEAMKFFDEENGWIWDIAKIDYKFGLAVLYLDQSNRT